MALSAGRYEAFGRALDQCESFIERRFLVALLFSERFGFEPLAEGGIAVDGSGIVLGQQIRVSGYRLDFALKRRGSTVRLAIELDGHKFHDASAEKAQRDRVRDRVLMSLGWRTIRFTGKEIVQDAMGCAEQAHRIMLAIADERTIAAPLAKASGVSPLQLPLRTTG